MSKALLLIDVQHEWADDSPNVTEQIQDVANAMRDDIPIIWVYTNWMSDITYPQLAGHLKLNGNFNVEAEHIYAPALIPASDDYVVSKDTNSAFTNLDLIKFLKNDLGVSELFIAGYRTTDCVAETAEHASEHFDVTLLSDLTADDFDETPDDHILCDFHDHGIHTMRSDDFSP